MKTRLRKIGKAKLVLITPTGTWVQDRELPIAPFAGLGIRLDVYEIFNVDSVVVGDFGYDVTCIGQIEMVNPQAITDKECEALGFVSGPYP